MPLIAWRHGSPGRHVNSLSHSKMDASITQAIIRCTNFAAIKHKNQRRKDLDATPYINHPIGTMSYFSY